MLDVLNGITDILHGLLDSPWLWIVVFLVAGLDALLPFMPSETTVIIVGVLVVPDTSQLVMLIVIAALGAWTGDTLGYFAGRSFGPVVLPRLIRGERERARFQWAHTQLRRHATVLLLAGRYLPGVRAVTMLGAGVLRFPARQFLLTDALGAGIWATYAALIGYLGGTTFQDHPVYGMLLAFAIGLAGATLVEVGRRVAGHRRRARSRARTSEAAEAKRELSA
jgi:membrane-associated protein